MPFKAFLKSCRFFDSCFFLILMLRDSIEYVLALLKSIFDFIYISSCMIIIM